MKTLRRYFRVWTRLALIGLANQTASPLSSTGYLLGKLTRVTFFLIFLSAIFKHTTSLAGYSLDEAALFFLTFNVVDMLAQLFFRGVYAVRGIVREGEFDYFLIQPFNALYRVAFNTVDFLDVITVLPVLIITGCLLHHLSNAWTWPHVAAYVLLAINGLAIAFAFHIAVAALAVLTQEMENTIWIYRDLMALGRFPSSIYGAGMQGVLTYVIPVVVMVSYPAQAFLGKLASIWMFQAVATSILTLSLSFWFWNYSIRHYTSSSS